MDEGVKQAVQDAITKLIRDTIVEGDIERSIQLHEKKI